MTKNLDLTKMNGGGPVPIPELKGPQGPTVHLEWSKPYELPKEGTATLAFRVKRVSHDVDAGRYEVCLELLSLKDIKGNKSAIVSVDTETGDALDALHEEKMKEHMEDMEEMEEESEEY